MPPRTAFEDRYLAEARKICLQEIPDPSGFWARRENLSRALDGLAAAIALDTSGFPEFVRDVIDSGRIQKFEYPATAI